MQNTKKKKPEQDLIDAFCATLDSVLHNNCKAKKYADIEYIDKDNALCKVEAKTHLSSDGNNAVHKIFGELLKLTGYPTPTDHKTVKYQLLLDDRPDEKGIRGGQFFQKLFETYIPKDKFIAFGKLVPVDKVIVFDMKTIKEYTWEEFYNLKEE